MSPVSWDKMLNEKNSGGGDARFLKIEDGTRIRLLQGTIAQWRQHAIRSPDDDNQVRFAVCPKGHDGRSDAMCPLCMKATDEEGKQRFPISRRFGVNVWDYENEEVKLLVSGPQVFDEFASNHEMGINPEASDYIIHKAGKGINTKYKMVRMDKEPFTVTIDAGDLHDLDALETPASIEDIFQKVEEMGMDYDALETVHFSLEEAEAFLMPYGKFKGECVEWVVTEETNYAKYLHDQKLKQGSYGDAVLVALHVVLLDRDETLEVPELDGGGKVTQPKATEKPKPAAKKQEPAEDKTAAAAAERSKVEDNLRKKAAESTNKAPAPESKPAAASTDDAPETLAVNVGGVVLSVAIEQAKALVQSGGGELLDPTDGVWLQDPEPEEPEPAADASAFDPENIITNDQGRFTHSALNTSYATKANAIRALKKLQDAAAPDDDAPAADDDPEPDTDKPMDKEALLERCKALVTADKELSTDFNKLLALFEDVSGHRDINKFTAEQLAELESRLTA